VGSDAGEREDNADREAAPAAVLMSAHRGGPGITARISDMGCSAATGTTR
jgi:hypothetical protein